MLPKEHRLSSPGAAFVARRGFQVAGPSLRIKWVPSRSAVSRVTVVAGLSVDKRATRRNLVKRRLREALRLLVPQLRPPVNAMVFAHKGAVSRSMLELRQELAFLLRKARLLS